MVRYIADKGQDFVSYLKKERLFTIVFAFIFFLGLFFTFAVPPFQKPDENAHFYRAAALSRGGFFCEKSEGERFFKLPEKYFVFADKMGVYRIALYYEQKFPKSDLLTIDSDLRDYGYERQKELEGFCSLNFIPYLPFVLPILVGEVLNSVLFSFYFSRFVALCLFLFALFWSYRKIRYSRLRWILLFYSVVPMVTFQASTIGYDYAHLALIPVLFALNIHFILDKKTFKKDLYLFLFSMFLLIVSKGGYYFFALLYFLIPRKKVSESKKGYIFYTALFISLCFLPIVLESYFGLGAAEFRESVSPAAQMELLRNPLFVMNLISETLSNFFYFYYQGFIGIFGWVDHGLPQYLYTLWLVPVAFVVSQICESRIYKNFLWKFLLISTVFLSTTFLILLIFYLTWNEVGSPLILGIQGRYFLLFTPYFLLCLGWIVHLLKRSKKLRYFILIFLLILLFYEIFSTTYDRYYGSSLLSDVQSLIQLML